MKKISLFIILFTSSILLNAQSIKLLNRQIKRDTAKSVDIKMISYAIVNCNPVRVKSVSYVNMNSGTLDISAYYLSPGKSINNTNIIGGLTLKLNKPQKNPSPAETIILRFKMEMIDTTIFNFDTLTIASTKEDKHPHWQKDKTNTMKYEFNQFTDFLGFNNQRPNGLLQQDLIIKFPVIASREGRKKDPKIFHQPFRSVVFNLLFNRIDKANAQLNYPAGTSIPNDTTKADSIRPYLTTLDIFKYSNLQVGLKFNLYTLHVKNFRINMAYEFNLLRNKPYYADTLRFKNTTYTGEDVRPVYSFAHKLAIYGNSDEFIAKQLKVAFNAGVMWIRLRDSYYKQFDAAVVDPFDRSTTLLPASDERVRRKSTPVWFFSGTLSQEITKDKSSIFFRVNYFYQTGTYRRYGGSADLTNFNPKNFYKDRFNNHYLQLQLGVSLDLNKFLNVKAE